MAVGVAQQHHAPVPFRQQRHVGEEVGQDAAVPQQPRPADFGVVPAHCVAAELKAIGRDLGRAAVRFGHPGGRQELPVPNPPAVQHGDQVAGHVVGAGEEHPAGQRAVGDRDVEPGHGRGEPVAVAHGQAVLPGHGRVGGGVAHAQRGEDVALDIAGVGFASGGLDDQPQQVVVGVAVLERRAGRAAQLQRGQRPHLALGGVRAGVEIGQRDFPGRGGQAAGLVQQVAHGDGGRRPRVGHAEPRQIAPDGGIQFDPPRLRQLHHGQGGERLGQRADVEGGLRDGWRAVRAGAAEAALVDDAPILHHGQGHAGQAQAAHLSFNVGVDGVEGGATGLLDGMFHVAPTKECLPVHNTHRRPGSQ